jgi:hypothetical protein
MTDSPPSNGEKPVDPRKLLRALVDLFSEQDLKDLCFDVQVDYENLEGTAKKHKARELIKHFSRRHRINVLIAAFQEHRPHVSLEEIAIDEEDEDPTETDIVIPPPTGPTQDKSNTIIASQGFAAIVRLMSKSDMRTAVVSFQTDFQAASEQIDLMNDYKLIHDLFQELENRYYLIHNDQKRLPDDDAAWDSIAINEPEVQGKISDIINVTKQAAFGADESRWAQQLDTVRERIRTGVEEYDLEQLQSGTRMLYRVLNRQPSRINAQLVTTATALRLDNLEQAMITINKNLTETEVSFENLTGEVKEGVEALGGLDDRLNELVREHNAWQEIDDELRRVEASLALGIEELEDAWFDLEPMARDLTDGKTEEWAVKLNEVIDALGQALSEQVVVTVRRLFRRLRSQAGRRFRQVDLELLTLCQELQRIGEQLDLILRQFNK